LTKFVTYGLTSFVICPFVSPDGNAHAAADDAKKLEKPLTSPRRALTFAWHEGCFSKIVQSRWAWHVKSTDGDQRRESHRETLL
jgi:hypothetical protein